MAARLVLGWGSSPWILTEYAQRSTGELRVVIDDGDQAEILRQHGVDVILGDPTNTETLRQVPGADPILIADDKSATNLRIAEAVRTVFPHAHLIVYTGPDPSSAQREELTGIADDVVNHIEEVGNQFVDVATSAAAVRAHRVRRLMDRIDGRLCVFMHDNPDPDAIASAMAVVELAETRDVSASAYYYGEITHQSNRAFVNLLDLEMNQLDHGAEMPECDAFALVDHSLPSVNNSLPPDVLPDFIFDHHTPRGPVDGTYVDLRESVGATSSIMVEYLRQLEIEVGEKLSTALLNGIRTDTRHFTRKVSPLDFDAAGYLWSRVDHDILDRIENPSVSRDTLNTIGEAIANRNVQGPILSACVGRIGERDALAQAAELLLQMEGMDVVLVYGMKDETVFASARARASMPGLDLSAIMRDAFGQIGTAGGHEEMAGAQIPVGVLGSPGGADEIDDRVAIADVMDDRFFETVQDWLRVDTHVQHPGQGMHE